jgi:hypothetical protein
MCTGSNRGMLTRYFGTGATTNLQYRITSRGKIRLAHHLLLQKVAAGAMVGLAALVAALVHSTLT